MKKFYQKKDIPTEESPILLQLQRRHTIMEVDNEAVSTDKKVLPFTRSNSTSSLVNKMQSISSGANSQNKPDDTAVSPDTSSSISNASTVFITESELSSSWLYKKAQMNTNETISTCDSTAQLNPIKEETKPSTQPRPNIKSTRPPSGRTEKPSSCCCYALIIIIITLSSLGILSAIGSILYMEFFAVYSNNDNQTTVQSTVNEKPRIPYPDDFYPMRKIGLSFDDDDDENQTVAGTLIILEEDSTSKKERSELQSNSTSEKSDFTNEDFGTQKVNEESNVIEDFIDKKKMDTDSNLKEITALGIITNKEEFLSTNNSVSTDGTKKQIVNEDTHEKESNESEILHPVNTFLLPNKKEESPYSKLFQLYQEFHETDSKNHGTSEKPSNSVLNQRNFESHDSTLNNLNTLRDNDSNFIQELEQEEEKLQHETEISDSNFGLKDEIESGLNNEIEKNNVNELSMSLLLNHQQTPENGNLEISSKDTLESEHGNTTDVHDSPENIPQLILEPLPQIPEEESLGFSNSFKTLDVDIESDNVHNSKAPGLNEPLKWNLPVLQSTNITNLFPKSLFQAPKDERSANPFRTMNVDSEEDDNPSKQNLGIPDLNESLDWNRPVLEANVAVPGPIEVIRRLNLGKDSATRNGQTSADLSNHDMRFSMAKALERLRLLDTKNILSSSRQKISDISKTASQKKSAGPTIQSEQEAGAERSHYLQNLRKKFFDK